VAGNRGAAGAGKSRGNCAYLHERNSLEHSEQLLPAFPAPPVITAYESRKLEQREPAGDGSAPLVSCFVGFGSGVSRPEPY
jgi:hypothetical protein